MKIFVLAQEVGSNAPGILYERLLRALSERFTLDLAVAQWQPSAEIKCRSLQVVKFPRMKHWMKRIMTVLFKGDPISKCRRRRIVFPEDTDVILSLCSNDRFWALEAGEYWKKRSGKPWACYFVDAIPSPVEWVGNGPYRRSVEAIVRRCAGSMSFFGGLSEQMLEYQGSMLPPTLKRKVFLPPIERTAIKPLPKPQSPPLFLYAGRIYGRRTAKYLLEAFSTLQGDARLIFAGTDERVRKEIDAYAPGCKDRIEVLPWVSGLEPLIGRATALVDLDADLEKDVYLSSKLFTYLQYPRPIISETGAHTPARSLLGGMKSVLLCPHESRALAEAMQKSISDFERFDYSDREAILAKADADRIAEELLQELSAL